MYEKQIVYTSDQIMTVVHEIKALMAYCPIITLCGPLGAGKTTLASALLKECGISVPVSSPTFAYVRSYTNARGQTFHHFDIYRIATLHDFQAMGFDEYLYQPHSWTIIEWPAVVQSLLTHSVCEVTLSYGADEAVRTATLRVL
jgi:tRNA threonylcarbamoyladenosine biosynthesis protein TsaE